MQVIEQSVELMRDFDGAEVMKFIEKCGRTCYLSQDNITDNSADNFVRNIIKRGHESVLEHFSCTFKIICDRGVSHELVRHRLASYSQESTRYCAYDTEKFDGELTFIKPCFWEKGDKFVNPALCYEMWEDTVKKLEFIYHSLRERGATPEQARSILPNSLKTEIVMTANLREWRHVLKLRTDKAAHPQMREVAFMILNVLKEKLPIVFEDIANEN